MNSLGNFLLVLLGHLPRNDSIYPLKPLLDLLQEFLQVEPGPGCSEVDKNDIGLFKADHMFDIFYRHIGAKVKGRSTPAF